MTCNVILPTQPTCKITLQNSLFNSPCIIYNHHSIIVIQIQWGIVFVSYKVASLKIMNIGASLSVFIAFLDHIHILETAAYLLIYLVYIVY